MPTEILQLHRKWADISSVSLTRTLSNPSSWTFFGDSRHKKALSFRFSCLLLRIVVGSLHDPWFKVLMSDVSVRQAYALKSDTNFLSCSFILAVTTGFSWITFSPINSPKMEDTCPLSTYLIREPSFSESFCFVMDWRKPYSLILTSLRRQNISAR